MGKPNILSYHIEDWDKEEFFIHCLDEVWKNLCTKVIKDICKTWMPIECPRCDVPAYTVKDNEIVFYECPDCELQWHPAQEFERRRYMEVRSKIKLDVDYASGKYLSPYL